MPVQPKLRRGGGHDRVRGRPQSRLKSVLAALVAGMASVPTRERPFARPAFTHPRRKARPENRVTLADERDKNGTPLARFDYTQCDNDRASIAYAKRVLFEIWDAAGAQDVLSIDRYAHLIGGCRMGTSPENSVVDSDHRCWDVSNLFITDGSALPTQGSANPALTIMALSSRLAERLAARRIPPERPSTPVG
jgi:choline dehydrogenase-like flavoprotein